MIIYPIIILVLLLLAFGLVYRKAYLIGPITDIEKAETLREVANINKRKDEVEIDSGNAMEDNFKRAEDLFRKKQYISAEKWYIEAAKADPKNDVIYARLGVIYIEQKNYKDAIEALSEAVALGPSVASRYFNLSFARNALGEKKEALNLAKRAVRIEPKNEKYKKWLDELRSSPF